MELWTACNFSVNLKLFQNKKFLYKEDANDSLLLFWLSGVLKKMFLSVINILVTHLGGSYGVSTIPPDINPFSRGRMDQNHENQMWPL